MPSTHRANIDRAARLFGYETWMQHQIDAFDYWKFDSDTPERMLLHYTTGGGKTSTALVCLWLSGIKEALVLAPLSTHKEWREAAALLGIDVTLVTHQKFRQKTFRTKRDMPIVVDEFHMLGKQTGVGWKKMRRLAASLAAPLIMCSATPNYNDAERCYCIEAILSPTTAKGGYLQWLYLNCDTTQNPFGMTPLVSGFKLHSTAAEYLKTLPGALYLPDPYAPVIHDIVLDHAVPDEFTRLGVVRHYELQTPTIVASQMEERHQVKKFNLIDFDTPLNPALREDVYDELIQIAGNSVTPIMVFSMSAAVAKALTYTAATHGARVGLITGDTTSISRSDTSYVNTTNRSDVLNEFKNGRLDMLVGTAAISTGTDGLDRCCDTLVILDDTDDPSLRRQLMGRILPRGTAAADISHKQFYRITFTDYN